MSYLSKGKEIEKEFAKNLSNVIFATQEQDIIEHWDIEADYNNTRKKFDVKSIKKQNRYDDLSSEIFHWVELSNVLGGKRTGSLYGKTDYFVYEIEDYWIIVDKIILQKFIEEKCKGKKIEKNKDPYTLFRREGRKDIVVKVKTIDLFYIATEIIKK
jgi:hypothetical protein